MQKEKIIIHDYKNYVLGSYAPQPVVFASGKGAQLIDVNGKKYIDLMSGLAVNVLGHQHPAIVRTIKKQANTILHTSNLYVAAGQASLAKKLTKAVKLSKAFFCNSGAEANEAAIKIARHASLEIYGREERVEIIAAQNSFHGRTLGALSATMQSQYQSGVGPLVSGFKSVPFNDIESLRAAMTEKTCAVILEPIQAEGGMYFPDTDYLKKVRTLCDEKKIFLILDEVQTGMGRTGKLFACQHYGVKPDILTLAKGLGGGVPVGAALFSDEIAQTVRPGLHASTFGGNPLAMAVAGAVLEQVQKAGFLAQVRKKGHVLRKMILKGMAGDRVDRIDQMGLFAAIRFKEKIEGAKLTKSCLERGVVINVIKDQVVRIAPPLIISEGELKKALNIFFEVCREA